MNIRSILSIMILAVAVAFITGCPEQSGNVAEEVDAVVETGSTGDAGEGGGDTAGSVGDNLMPLIPSSASVFSVSLEKPSLVDTTTTPGYGQIEVEAYVPDFKKVKPGVSAVKAVEPEDVDQANALSAVTVKQYNNAGDVVSEQRHEYFFSEISTAIISSSISNGQETAWARHDYRFRDNGELWLVRINPYIQTIDGKMYVRHPEDLDAAMAKHLKWDEGIDFKNGPFGILQVIIKSNDENNEAFDLSEIEFEKSEYHDILGAYELRENYDTDIDNYIDVDDKVFGRRVVRSEWDADSSKWVVTPGSLEIYLGGPDFHSARPFLYVRNMAEVGSRPEERYKTSLFYNYKGAAYKQGGYPDLDKVIYENLVRPCGAGERPENLYIYDSVNEYPNIDMDHYEYQYKCTEKTVKGKIIKGIESTTAMIGSSMLKVEMKDGRLFKEQLFVKSSPGEEMVLREEHIFEYGHSDFEPLLPPPSLSVNNLDYKVSSFYYDKAERMMEPGGLGLKFRYAF